MRSLQWQRKYLQSEIPQIQLSDMMSIVMKGLCGNQLAQNSRHFPSLCKTFPLPEIELPPTSPSLPSVEEEKYGSPKT